MAEALLEVFVVYSDGPRSVKEAHLHLPQGSEVADAVRASGLIGGLSDATVDRLTLGVRGRKASPTQILRDHDRVEIYRPLLVDPKVARRERFTRQGAKSAGLFASRRPGAKAGY